MINSYKISILSLAMGSLTLTGGAFAHGTKMHGKMLPADTQMNKLHAMMPMFSLASARLETALEKGEVVVAEAEAEKIIAEIPDLKKSEPHKNPKQRKKFVGLAVNLGETVNSTLDQAKKGDLPRARAEFKKVEEVCAACHTIFRE